MQLAAQTLLAANGLESAKEIIATAIANSPDVRARYGWAAPIFAKTTEAFIWDSLRAEAPERIYKINPLSQNLTAAGQLIDLAIARQDAIYELEIGAVEAVLSDLMFDDTVAAQQRIAVASLEASIAQSGANGAGAASTDVDKIFETQRAVQTFRRNARSAHGSALNLAERIAFLREQQAETVRSIFERLYSVELVLPSSGLGRPEPLPQWFPDAGLENLRNLARWTKSAIKSVERSLSTEFVYNIVFSTQTPGLRIYDAQDVVLSQQDLIAKLRAPGFDDIKFDFDQSLLNQRIGSSTPKSVRLLELGVGVVFDEDFEKIRTLVTANGDVANQNATREIVRDWQQRQRFGVRIVPPAQVGTLKDGSPSKRWNSPRWEMDYAVPAASVPALGQLATSPDNQALNINPLGRWIVSVNDRSTSVTATEGKLSDRPFGTNTKMTDVTGIMFLFRVAIRWS